MLIGCDNSQHSAQHAPLFSAGGMKKVIFKSYFFFGAG
ncbi:hypothetical protein LTSEJOH_0749 [Salmonella enterica subsp. enterica serovar Johannesburg str. S5-703]|nr:hypothetical protein LTSEJOH_0749 [Salmonella enterica subsp. enterica serovar Johannesburg str. S5-703]